MFIELPKLEQGALIESAVKKAGGYRKLAKILKIPKSTLGDYKKSSAIPEKRFKKIIKFLEINQESLEIKRLDENWKQVLGGKACVKSKKAKGTFELQLKKAQKKGIKGISRWHKFMKKNNPTEYYLGQYEKFKKIGGYKFITKRGERVRNKFEKQTADLLHEQKINYEYEPLVRIGERYFFPDFVINNKIIIECTEWRGEIKAYKLKEKIKYLKKKYKIYVVIPKHLYSNYKILHHYLVLGLDELVPVAQLVRAHGC